MNDKGEQTYVTTEIDKALKYDRDKVGFKTVVDMASQKAREGMTSGVVSGTRDNVEVLRQADVKNWKKVAAKVTQRMNADGSKVNTYGAQRGGQQEAKIKEARLPENRERQRQKQIDQLIEMREQAERFLAEAQTLGLSELGAIDSKLRELKSEVTIPTFAFTKITAVFRIQS